MKNHLTDQDVSDLRYLFISQFDIDITEDEARDYGYWLIETVKLAFSGRQIGVDIPFDATDYTSWTPED